MTIPKSFMITTVINVNDTRPVAFQPSTFVVDNSVKSKRTQEPLSVRVIGSLIPINAIADRRRKICFDFNVTDANHFATVKS